MHKCNANLSQQPALHACLRTFVDLMWWIPNLKWYVLQADKSGYDLRFDGEMTDIYKVFPTASKSICIVPAEGIVLSSNHTIDMFCVSALIM